MNCRQSLCFSAILLAFVAVSSFAESYSSIDVLIKNQQYAEAEALLTSKLKSDAGDDSAHYYPGVLSLQQRGEENIAKGIESFKKCVDLKPQSSMYSLWLGRAYGLELFQRAVPPDPKNFEARYDPVRFSLQAPGIAGGSNARAEEQAEEYSEIHPEHARMLWAAVSPHDEQDEKAEAQLASMKKPRDELLQGYFRNSYTAVGFAALTEKQPVLAQRIYTRSVTQFPENATGYHGLGRSLLDLELFDAAITHFEKAVQRDKSVGSQHRLGQAYEKKGDRQKAILHSEEFLKAVPKAQKKTIEDAKDRIEDLKKNYTIIPRCCNRQAMGLHD